MAVRNVNTFLKFSTGFHTKSLYVTRAWIRLFSIITEYFDKIKYLMFHNTRVFEISGGSHSASEVVCSYIESDQDITIKWVVVYSSVTCNING